MAIYRPVTLSRQYSPFPNLTRDLGARPNGPAPAWQSRNGIPPMKVKIFDVALHNVPAGKSPATHLEEQINSFLKHYPNLQAVATHMNTLVVPAEPSGQPGSEAGRPSVILFTTLFYQS